MPEDPTKHPNDERPVEAYEPPEVEDIEPNRQPSVTAAGADGTQPNWAASG